jgi:sugar lactone lactonase YvrE
MPVRNVTTAAFGGPALKTLYVSTAHHAGERLSGSLFRLEVDVPGLPENRFQL